MITITKKNTLLAEGILWAAYAVPYKDEMKPSLRLLSVDKNRVVGTDGHRLHLVEAPCGLEPGLYQITKRTKSELNLELDQNGERYPDIDSVLPEINGQVQVEYTHSFEANVTLAKVLRAMNPDFAINPDYLKAALYPDSSGTAYVDPEKGVAVMIRGKADSGIPWQSLVMPIRAGE